MQVEGERTKRPVFTYSQGNLLTSADINLVVRETMHEEWLDCPESFPVKAKSVNIIRQRCRVFRTLCKTSTTRALIKKGLDTDIATVNRWYKEEKAKERKP
eukprot:1162390-Ditylum_brightwellii.AAC.1